jgi:hypothetical protein
MVEYEDLRVPDEGESCINIDEVDVDVKWVKKRMTIKKILNSV